MEYELCEYLGFDKPTEMTYEAWQDYFGIGHDVEMMLHTKLKCLKIMDSNNDYRLPEMTSPSRI